jgi:CBS domain-containing protein
MRKKPVSVSPKEPVSSLTYLMIRENIGAIVVVDKGKPVGIITEKDILDRVVTPRKDVYKTFSRDVMSKPVISIESSQSIKEALSIMKKYKIRRLVVVENNALTGLITERRLLASIYNLIS